MTMIIQCHLPKQTPAQTSPRTASQKNQARDSVSPHTRLAFGNTTPRTSQQCAISSTVEVESRSFAACTAARQAFHVSEAGPASTSNREAMNGSSANGNGYAKLVTRQKPRKAPGNETASAPVDFDAMFSKEAHEREMPKLRQLATAFNGIPGLIPLHGGLPPASAFPLTGLQLTLKDGSTIDIDDPQEIVAAQQYNLTMNGHPSVLNWVLEHTRKLHSPSPAHQTIITGGSNHTLEMVMRTFLEPGDAMLCEEYTYPHMPESLLLPVGYRSVRCEMDALGIIPERLLATLEGMEARGERIPRLLYTIPTGQNPTGATQTPERKRCIYEICRRFNIIIMEDDPYYYLQYQEGEPPRGLSNLGASYLSMDTDGRVCRLDSFSKVLAPGLRIAWLTAHKKVIEKVLYHFHGVAMGACSLSQVVVGALLQRMGQEGFEAHVKDIQAQYSERAAIIQAAAAKHLKGLADWEPVTAGMFMWLRLRGFEDAAQILGELQDAKVIVVPGRLARHSGPDSKTACPYVRLSFVTAPVQDLEVAMERLGDLLRRLEGQAKPPAQPLSPRSQKAALPETCEVL